MHVCERSRRALEAGPARTILEAFAIYAQPVDTQAGVVRLLEIGAPARLTVAVSTKSTCRHGVPLPAIIEDLGGHTDTARFPGGLPVGHHARETEHAGRGSRIREGNDALRAEAVRRSEVVDDGRQYDQKQLLATHTVAEVDHCHEVERRSLLAADQSRGRRLRCPGVQSTANLPLDAPWF